MSYDMKLLPRKKKIIITHLSFAVKIIMSCEVELKKNGHRNILQLYVKFKKNYLVRM